MIEVMKMIGKWFTVYDESTKSGRKVSATMIMVAISVMSTLIVRFTPISTGLSDEQIVQISEYGFAIFGIVVGWLRYDTTKELAVRSDRVARNSNKRRADTDEHAADILNED